MQALTYPSQMISSLPLINSHPRFLFLCQNNYHFLLCYNYFSAWGIWTFPGLCTQSTALLSSSPLSGGLALTVW